MTIHQLSASDFTLVQNSFIDQYMADANGEFVKIYLYLLRCCTLDAQLSLSSIADVFNCTERDVRRALSYWERQHLLRLGFSNDGVLTDVAFIEGTSTDEQRAERLSSYAQRAENSAARELAYESGSAASVTGHSRMTVTADRKKELASNEEVRQLLFVIEQYMKKTLSSTELNHILYFYDELHFSPDLIEYLVEYCLSKGTHSINYMRTVALEWFGQGIHTVDEARKDTNMYNKQYYTVLNAFGIRGRGPAQAEIDYMQRWFQAFGFSIDIVLEACRRTINKTHTPSFSYADSILKSWKDKGVRHFKDIAQLDKPAAAPPAADSAQTGAAASNVQTGTRFSNFTQRDYDYAALEQQLLSSQRRRRHVTE
ncbi:MAG: DnaD domain protein [Eubacteriales bacterium]|nr:DnaD domain protein [Eubacteriales bacterium]